ncbi:hypothetical protein GGX14DRAFT_643336 [Mycena pura]|uniref:Uncharacterized protein n=1 Tax=Mycena pura TaxID=153505 RepID=A0AAD6VGA1_9AGAR|nr:hypothetical protein GGX14DRAFT_643336 [Mycena pura]
MSDRGYCWQNLPPALEDDLQASLRVRRPISVALGVQGAFVVVYSDGTISFNLRDLYPVVEGMLSNTQEAAWKGGIVYVALNPHMPAEFYVVYGDGSASWSLPTEWARDVTTVSREIKPVPVLASVSLGGTVPPAPLAKPGPAPAQKINWVEGLTLGIKLVNAVNGLAGNIEPHHTFLRSTGRESPGPPKLSAPLLVVSYKSYMYNVRLIVPVVGPCHLLLLPAKTWCRSATHGSREGVPLHRHPRKVAWLAGSSATPSRRADISVGGNLGHRARGRAHRAIRPRHVHRVSVSSGRTAHLHADQRMLHGAGHTYLARSSHSALTSSVQWGAARRRFHPDSLTLALGTGTSRTRSNGGGPIERSGGSEHGVGAGQAA